MHDTFDFAVVRIESDHERPLDDEPQPKLYRHVASDMSERNSIIDPFESAFYRARSRAIAAGPKVSSV